MDDGWGFGDSITVLAVIWAIVLFVVLAICLIIRAVSGPTMGLLTQEVRHVDGSTSKVTGFFNWFLALGGIITVPFLLVVSSWVAQEISTALTGVDSFGWLLPIALTAAMLVGVGIFFVRGFRKDRQQARSAVFSPPVAAQTNWQGLPVPMSPPTPYEPHSGAHELPYGYSQQR